MPTNPGTVDEKPVLVDVVGDKAGTDGTDGDEGAGTDGDLGAFFASLLATVLADFFLAVDSVGLAID
jgi:hypothetical protein